VVGDRTPDRTTSNRLLLASAGAYGTAGGGKTGVGSGRFAREVASPPASTISARTTLRAVFIRFTFRRTLATLSSLSPDLSS
jgi:hypothetical protein